MKVVGVSSILGEIALTSAEELEVPHTGGRRLYGFTDLGDVPQTAADHLSFADPETASQIAESEWRGLRLSVDPTLKVLATTISSRPLLASYLRTGEQLGWVHTPYDNSTTLWWVDQARLDSHVKVSALTIVKVMETAVVQGLCPSRLGSCQLFLVEEVLLLCDSARTERRHDSSKLAYRVLMGGLFLVRAAEEGSKEGR